MNSELHNDIRKLVTTISNSSLDDEKYRELLNAIIRFYDYDAIVNLVDIHNMIYEYNVLEDSVYEAYYNMERNIFATADDVSSILGKHIIRACKSTEHAVFVLKKLYSGEMTFEKLEELEELFLDDPDFVDNKVIRFLFIRLSDLCYIENFNGICSY